MLSSAFLSAVEPLKPGEVSEPFWSEQGLHVIKLLEKVSSKDEAAIRDRARKELLDERFQKEYKSWLKTVKENSYIEIRL
jgi:peptidyl-prolyl cis-trans isomerase SurA